MSYQEWFENHGKKHKAIVDKLSHLSDEEIIDYFDFENMVKKENDFCPLYKEAKKCHDIEELNCYLCGCPNFRVNEIQENHKTDENTILSYCDIDSVDGDVFPTPKGIHQNCAGCIVPHKKLYVKKHFNRDWMSIMKAVIKENK